MSWLKGEAGIGNAVLVLLLCLCLALCPVLSAIGICERFLLPYSKPKGSNAHGDDQ